MDHVNKPDRCSVIKGRLQKKLDKKDRAIEAITKERNEMARELFWARVKLDRAEGELKAIKDFLKGIKGITDN